VGSCDKGVGEAVTTADKISGILNEIEAAENKTTARIVDIFMNCAEYRETPGQFNSQGAGNPFQFDINELKRWKELNNSICSVEYYRNIFSYRKILGGAVVFFRRAARRLLRFLIEPIVKEQNEFNGSVTASVNALYNNAIVVQSFMDHSHAVNAKAEAIEATLNARLDTIEKEINARMDATETTLNEDFKSYAADWIKMNESIDHINERLLEYPISHISRDEFEEIRKKTETALEKLNQTAKTLNDGFDELSRETEQSELNILRFIKNSGSRAEANKQTAVDDSKQSRGESKAESSAQKTVYQGIDYFVFENHFRGSRKCIRKAMEQYIPYFAGRTQIIDLGCGRGEFLELLKQNQIEATGVDIYREFVDYCQMKGLSALTDDAVAYVSNLPDDSVGGLFASQLAEHLETDRLVSLCGAAYQKLQPGCCFILETPNPTSLAIYTNGFYVDPTHVKPVHPKTLEYFLRQAGFKHTETLFTENSKPDYRLPLLDGEHIGNLSEFNDGVNALSDILFGSQDYAVIARK
jgi:O-antigen chain-terminating methyltransferase